MNPDNGIATCVDAVLQILREGESVVQIRLAQPEPGGKADYFRRYKVDLAIANGSGTEITSRRCVVVKISSNTGKPQVESLGWDPIPNVIGL